MAKGEPHDRGACTGAMILRCARGSTGDGEGAVEAQCDAGRSAGEG